MIGNIVDKRTNKYDVVCEAIFEPSCHDNRCKGASQFNDYPSFVYHEVQKCTVEEACKWANEELCYVTIFLYDLDTNVGEVAHEKIRAKGKDKNV